MLEEEDGIKVGHTSVKIPTLLQTSVDLKSCQ